jgi:hypothetical protein
MALQELQSFYLVGGTALSLLFGHRISVDIDLFCINEFDQEALKAALQKEFGLQFAYEGGFSKFGIFCLIDGIKTDIVRYPHPIICQTQEENQIRLYNPSDIAAMKIQAILGRGRKKDFWDIAELLNHFTLKEIIEFHSQKFPSQQLLISIPQAVSYFADADESDDPISLKGQTWERVKKVIQKHVADYLK